MKKHIRKGIVFMLVALLVLPILSLSSTSIVSAKTKKMNNPTLTLTNKSLVSDGETFTLSVKDTGDNVKSITWYSKNDKIASVKTTDDSNTVIVTEVSNGTTQIRCSITYTDKADTTYSCKVKVKVPKVDVPVSKVTEDNTKAQVKLISLERTGYYTLTATFDGAIKTPGYVVVNDTQRLEGIIDQYNSCKVNYNLTSTLPLLTETQKVAIGFWNGCNVLKDDTSADVLKEYYISFKIILPTLMLPSPISIMQSLDNLNVIYINFKNKVDKASAENIANYSITNATILSAEVLDIVAVKNISNSSIRYASSWSSDTVDTIISDTIKLTLKQGAVDSDLSSRRITIGGIKSYDGPYTEMNLYETGIILKENVIPVLTSYKYVYPAIITLTFNEPIMGTPSFIIKQNQVTIDTFSEINGTNVIITLKSLPNNYEYMQLIPTVTNSITDLKGNPIVTGFNLLITPNQN